MSLSERERFPWLTEDGRRLLHHLMQHPNAPRFNHQCGDRLTAAGLERVRAFERELRQPRRVWKTDELPVWLPSFAARCLAEVPFYRQHGGDPLDFLKLPTCNRADLNREPWSFVPDSEPLENLIMYDTSGTTGHPVFVLSHPEVSSKYLPALHYALARHGVTLKGGPGRVAIVLVCAQNLTFTYASVSAYLNGAGFLKLNLNPLDWNDPNDRVRFLDECNPEIYSGDPFSFTQLAQLPLQTRPKALVSTAMTLLPGLKHELERHFGCPVIDIYSLNESRLIAVGTDAGFEVVPHDLYVEILAPDGKPCPPGVRGEITITGGRNPFLPLLRYRTGDHAALELRPDAVILKDLEGRAPVFFFDTTGRVVNNIDISYILKPCALSQFTLHQAGDRSLVFKTRDHPCHERLARELLLKIFGQGQVLTIGELTDADCRNGKIVQYTSELPPPEVNRNPVAFQSITWYEVMRSEKTGVNEFLSINFACFGCQLSMVDLVGSFFALLSVWLTVRQSNWCWPTGIVNNLFFIVLFFRGQLYCDMGLQILYILLSLYGWYYWLFGGERRSALRVSPTTPRMAVFFAAIYLAGTVVLARMIDRYTDTNVPWWDASMTMMCIVAQWMLSWKLLENWWVWIASNVSQFFLYQYKHMYVISWLQIVFIILSIRGFWLWWKELRGDRREKTKGEANRKVLPAELVSAPIPDAADR